MKSLKAGEFIHPRYWFYRLILITLRMLSYLPLPLLWLLGGAIGELGYHFQRSARRVALKNVELCFPGLNTRDRARLVKRHFHASGQTLFGLAIAWWGMEKRLQRLVRFRDRHYYDDALKAGKNIILLAPHFLGLEIGGVRLSQERRIVSMYKAPKNRFVENVLHSRTRYGAILIERSGALKSLIRLIRQGLPFYYLPDQDPGRSAAAFAPFLGVPVATITALSRIAQLTDAVVIPCFTRQLAYGRGYEIIFYPPLQSFPCGDAGKDARRMNAEIEKGVAEMPEQYMWTYKRFKTRPNNAPSPYA